MLMKRLILLLLFIQAIYSQAQNPNGVIGTSNWLLLDNFSAIPHRLNANFTISSTITDKYNNFYAAGGFTDTSGYYYVAKWDGSAWSELLSGTVTDTLVRYAGITSLAVDDSGNVYAATGNTWYHYIAKWDGKSWSVFGSLLAPSQGYFTYIATDFIGNVYATGIFTNSKGFYYVAKWNGSNWAELGTGTNALNANGLIYTIAIDNAGNVYAAGVFSNSNGLFYIAKWNGTNWTQMGTGFYVAPNNVGFYTITLVTDSWGNVFAAGPFISPDGYDYVAKWNGSSWAEVGTGSNAMNANGRIISVAIDKNSGNMYAGGLFGDLTSGYKYVAMWDGTSWSQLGTGLANALGVVVGSILVAVDCPGNVYATGIFLDVSLQGNVFEWVLNNPIASSTPLLVNNDVLTTSCPDHTIVNELSNDAFDQKELTGVTISRVSYGQASVLPNNQISYIPLSQFIGIDTIEYQICVNYTACSSACKKANIILTVIARDSTALLANPDQSEVLGCQTVFKNVLANDIFSDSTFITMTIIQNPNHGQYTLSGKGGISYTSAHNFEGSDTISYNICKNTCTTWCSQSLYTIQVEKPNLTIPNLITPNSDNKNDCFVVKNLSPDSRMEIYNSWGDMVFHSDSYKDDWCGDNLNDGVYYYYYKDTCYNTTDKGWVEITR
jgi:hypothetical protein